MAHPYHPATTPSHLLKSSGRSSGPLRSALAVRVQARATRGIAQDNAPKKRVRFAAELDAAPTHACELGQPTWVPLPPEHEPRPHSLDRYGDVLLRNETMQPTYDGMQPCRSQAPLDRSSAHSPRQEIVRLAIPSRSTLHPILCEWQRRAWGERRLRGPMDRIERAYIPDLNRVPPEDATRAYEAAEHKFKVQIRKDNNMHRKFFHLGGRAL